MNRTAALIAERAGSSDVYEHQTDEEIAARVRGLLEGGVTVDEAVSLALLNNPDFQALFQQIGASRADVVQSRMFTNPTFTITLLYPEGGGRAKIPFGIGQEITDFWQVPVRKKIAQAQLEQVVLTVAHKGVDVATETRIACYKLLALQQVEAMARENLSLVEVPAASASSGRPEKSVLEGRVALIAASRDAEVQRAVLARLVGLSRWPEGWELRDELPSPAPEPQDSQQLIDFASSERMDARAVQMQTQAAEEQLTRATLSVFPRIVVGIGGEQKDRRPLAERKLGVDTLRSSIAKGALTPPPFQTQGQRDYARRQIIDFLFGPLFQITLPIWDQNQAQIAKARFALEQRRREREGLLNVIAQDIQQSHAQLEAARETVALYQQLLEAAERDWQQTRSRKTSKEATSSSMQDARKAWMAQRANVLTAWRDYAVAAANLQRAVGGRLPPSAQSQPETAR